MAITLGTAVTRSDGRTQRSISQSAAATDDIIVADPVDGRVVVYDLYLVIGTTGSIALKGGATTLTGVIVATAGVPYRFHSGDKDNAVFELAESEALTITTVTGAATGYIVYDIET